MPLLPGIIQSRISRSGASAIASSHASSPSRASDTAQAQSESSRRANAPVKRAGMCWAMTMGGAPAGQLRKSRASASGPPVDEPTATSCGRGPGSPDGCSGGARGGTGGVLRRTPASAAARSASLSITALSSRNSRTPTCGFATTSTAPDSSACMASCEPRSASAEHTTTGSGSSRINRRRKVRPSMRGISRSSRITSGRARAILSLATMGFAAAVTVMPGSRESTSAVTMRITAESSMTSTCRLFMRRSCGGRRWGRRRRGAR